MSLPRITRLYWDQNNEDHLWERRVSPEDVEEILFGCDGEDPTYRQRRSGDYLLIYGKTVGGRLLKMVGEFISDGQFRVFGAIDMDEDERRVYRKGK